MNTLWKMCILGHQPQIFQQPRYIQCLKNACLVLYWSYEDNVDRGFMHFLNAGTPLS